jgi:Carboxypeptidase regulatory-like domain/IPT/TIG domain
MTIHRRSRVALGHAWARPKRQMLISWLALCLALAVGALALAVSAPAAQAEPLPGDIAGTVTNTALQGLANIDVVAFQPWVNGGWYQVAHATTDSTGDYDFGSLAAGTYSVRFEDAPGSYLTQFYANEPDIHSATDVVVNAGATTSHIDATLIAAGAISGTISVAVPTDLTSIDVMVYQPDGSGGWVGFVDVSPASDGTYTITGLPSGTYRLGFQDLSGANGPQFYPNAPGVDSATDVTVTGGQTTSGIDASLGAAGHITGTVTDPGYVGLDIEVSAYQPDGQGGWSPEGWALAASDGSYDIGGLSTGSYRVMFWESMGLQTKFYKDSTSLDLADDVAVEAGEATAGVDAMFQTDLTPPTTTVFGADTLWHSTPVTLTLSAVDNAGGSGMSGGLAMTEYKIGDGPWLQGTTAVVPAPVDHSGDGPQTVSYKSCDAAGNWELVKTVVVRIDTTEDTFDDTNPPEVSNFSIAPTEFDTESADQTLTVTMTLTDDQSGVRLLGDTGGGYCSGAGITPVSGGQGVGALAQRISGDDHSGVYTATLTVPRGSSAGDWLAYVNLADKAGNHVSLTAANLVAKFGPGCATVTNTAPPTTADDTTPPEVTEFSVTPTEFNTESADQTLTVEMRLTDAQSGVFCDAAAGAHEPPQADLAAAQSGESRLGTFTRISGDQYDGVYAATITVPRWSTEGAWHVGVSFGDKIGNYASLTAADLAAKFGPDCATVTNTATTADTTPPRITAFSITPAEFTTESADQTLTVKMTLSDEQSGSPIAALELFPLIGNQITQSVIGFGTDWSGDDHSGVYTMTLRMPKLAKVGVWCVDLNLSDKVGNSVTLDSDALSALLTGTDGLVVNTATAQQVTIDRDWTITTGGNSVTFPADTVVTRADDGVFAFYQMTAQQFTLDNSVTSTGLDGVPVATLRFGIPGLNLSFSQPVDVSMEVGSQYNGDTLDIQSLAEAGTAWANDTMCQVVDGRIHFTVRHATRFVATETAPPTVTNFTPASGPVGTTVTVTGTHFTGATAVSFNGHAAADPVVASDSQLTATVPAAATTGSISITTPCGTATSDTAYTVTVPTPTPTDTPTPPTPTPTPAPTVTPTPTITLKLSGLKGGALKLGKSMTAKGIVTPTSLAGSRVTLTAQLKKGAKWVKAKTCSALITSTGAYSWKYKPAKKASYRVQCSIAKSSTHGAAETKWLPFKVK